MSTICAVSTPVGNGGVAVIRISGEKALGIASKIFEPFKNQPTPRKAIFGKLKFDNVVDDALGLYFPSPNSFTGENVVELQIHGGYYLANAVITALISNGCVMAERGEFSKRAVLNGKMDMSQAEGIIDMINANSIASLRASSSLMHGKMREFVENIQTELTNLMCEVNVALDYPEHDIEYITSLKVSEICTNLANRIENQLKTSKTGLQIKNGVNVALVGEPNVGKSSLLNALLGFERAIVTDIAGTTRDTITESYEFNGMRFNIVDTAGIRDTQDKVENAGIMRAKQEIESADLVLLLMDSKTDLSINNQNVIKVLNKIDIKDQNIDCDIKISAKNNINLIPLKQLIFDKTVDKDTFNQDVMLTNIRHINCLKQAKENLQQAINDANHTTLDCLSIPLMQAWNILGEITGTTATDTIINEIFARFCLGK